MKITITDGGDTLGEFTLDSTLADHVLKGGNIEGYFGGLIQLLSGIHTFTNAHFRKKDCVKIDNKPDMVNHPPHYNQGGVECIDALRAAIGDEAFKGHCTATAIKYLWRWQQKGGVQDLEKAKWYINKCIEVASAK